MKLLPSALALATVSLLPFAATSHASTPGTDAANNAAYTDGWQNGDNGGTGFLAWALVTSISGTGSAGSFPGSSTQLANPGANIDTGGVSLGAYGQGANTFFDGFRGFAGGALSVGQTFSLSIAVNFRNGFKGLDLKTGGQGGSNVFNFNVGGDDYTVNGATIGNAYSDNTAFRISLTQTTAAGGTWRVERSGGVTDLDTGTYTGTPDTLHLYAGTTDGGPANNLYANSFSIVPEPGSWAWLGAGALAFGVWARRRAGSVIAV